MPSPLTEMNAASATRLTEPVGHTAIAVTAPAYVAFLLTPKFVEASVVVPAAATSAPKYLVSVTACAPDVPFTVKVTIPTVPPSAVHPVGPTFSEQRFTAMRTLL